MTVQLLAQGGLGAPHGGAHAAGGEIKSGSNLGVAEAAVPQNKGDSLLAGQLRQRRPYSAALVESDDRISGVRGDRIAVDGGLLTKGATTSGAEVVQRGVRRGHGHPPHGFASRHRGAPEPQEDLLRHVLGLVLGAEYAGGNGDDSWIGGAEDVFEVGSDVPWSRRS
jgi:hypothetical protein